MNAVLHTKYAVAAPTSGRGMAASAGDHANSANGTPGGGPPSSVYTMPVAFTVRTSDAMLKSVRCSGERVCVRKVHCDQALVAATNIVGFAPSSSSEAKSTAYDTDIVDPLVVSGRLTFSADATEEKSSSARNRTGLGIAWRPKYRSVATPAASTVPT